MNEMSFKCMPVLLFRLYTKLRNKSNFTIYNSQIGDAILLAFIFIYIY